MPLREEDSQNREKHRQEMEKFADYRNYLTFSMYEQVIDENGMEKKNYVDDMAGVDSGGEGQNPEVCCPAGRICHVVYAADKSGFQDPSCAS